MSESTPAPVEGKTCSKCGEFKALEEFQLRRDGRVPRRRNDCKKCCTARVNAWKQTNPERCRQPITSRRQAARGYRTCSKCSKVKPRSEFEWDNGRIRSFCRSCPESTASPRDRFPTPPPGYKWCTKCAECKPLEEFPRRSGGQYGSWCNECVARHNRTQYERPEVRADRLARRRQWGLENPTWDADWRRQNPEKARSNGRAAAARRRARQLSLPVEPYTVTELLERDGTDCVLCGEPLDLSAEYPHPLAATIEHLECISWPGSAGDVPSNCAVAHFRCNSKRSDRPHAAAARKRAQLLAAEAAAS